MSSIYLCKSCMTYLFISLFVQFGDPWIRTICVLWAFAYLKKKQSHAYLLGLLAMIKCSICSYQCDNWYSSNRKIACHANFSLGRSFLELARGHLTCCPGIALRWVRHTLRGNQRYLIVQRDFASSQWCARLGDRWRRNVLIGHGSMQNIFKCARHQLTPGEWRHLFLTHNYMVFQNNVVQWSPAAIPRRMHRISSELRS